MCNLRRCSIATKRIKCSIWNKLKQHWLDIACVSHILLWKRIRSLQSCALVCWRASASTLTRTQEKWRAKPTVERINERTNEYIIGIAIWILCAHCAHIRLYGFSLFALCCWWKYDKFSTFKMHKWNTTKSSADRRKKQGTSNCINSSITNARGLARSYRLHDK